MDMLENSSASRRMHSLYQKYIYNWPGHPFQIIFWIVKQMHSLYPKNIYSLYQKKKKGITQLTIGFFYSKVGECVFVQSTSFYGFFFRIHFHHTLSNQQWRLGIENNLSRSWKDTLILMHACTLFYVCVRF